MVDSCMDALGEEPAALTYLRELGLDPAAAVRLVLITHWDDDHVRGVARIVRACPEANVACSAALHKTDIVQFVVEQEIALGGVETGVDELRSVMKIVQERGGQIIWAKANTVLHPTPPGSSPNVMALSPSENAFQRGVEALIQAATGLKAAVPRRFRAPEGPNGASVAASVRSGYAWVLLGGDLERSNNPLSGWDAVIADAAPAEKASLVKVPHHGSNDAHHRGMWSELASEQPIAVLTPLRRGSNDLPEPTDVDRLIGLCGRLFQTARPTLVRARKDADVERMLRRVGAPRIQALRGWGQVRARRLRDDPQNAWTVELAGDAVELT